MRKSMVAIAAACSSLLILSGCSTESETATETAAPAASGSAAAAGTQTTTTCAPGDRIGVALPAQTSENWTLAKQLFEEQITAAGFTPDVQFADSGSSAVASQQANADNMLTQQAKVLVIGAENGQQLGSQAEAAEAAGVPLIAYDRPIDAKATDYYVAFDNFKVGQLQGQALLDGLKAKKAEGPYNIELFSGSSDDANSAVFFGGAMDVLQPKIDDGTLVVASGQTDIKQTATAGWKAENAQSRTDALLTSTYGTKSLDGVLSPNDTLARAILTSVESQGKPLPVVTGQDSEVESVKSIMAGKQYSTINKDTRVLVAKAIDMAKVLQTGKTPEVNDTKSYNNGVKIVPAYLLPPVIVTKANAAEAYANDPVLSPLTK